LARGVVRIETEKKYQQNKIFTKFTEQKTNFVQRTHRKVFRIGPKVQ